VNKKRNGKEGKRARYVSKTEGKAKARRNKKKGGGEEGVKRAWRFDNNTSSRLGLTKKGKGIGAFLSASEGGGGGGGTPKKNRPRGRHKRGENPGPPSPSGNSAQAGSEESHGGARSGSFMIDRANRSQVI